MLAKNLKTFFLFLIFTQIFSMVFCGDIDCLEGGVSKNCDAVLCSILDKHTPADPFTATQNTDTEEDCRCVCHVLYSITEAELEQGIIVVSPYFNFDPTLSIFPPIQQVFRPPLT